MQGNMTQDQLDNLPIDIHYNKLLDWLINRRHCSQTWQATVLTIREKINNAIQDMPEVEEITKMLSGTYINYFHCIRIVELLRETEKASKNIFGGYSSKRMKDWLEILKLYETENVGLAEAAQLLTRNVNYEVPALKRQITKCKQGQTECTRKQGEYTSTAAEMREKFQTDCKQMGIEGKKIKHELVALVQDLPIVFEEIARSGQDLDPSVKFYSDFVQFTISKEQSESVTPVTKFIMTKGNATTYEWRTGKTPKSIIQPHIDFNLEEEEEPVNEEIDWGTIGTEDTPATIDFGEGAIDFGDTDEAEIDWGAGDIEIEVASDGHGDLSIETPEGDTEGVAKGMDALTVFENTTTRNMFIDELLELEAFLTMRLCEMRSEADVLSSSQFQSAPQSLQVDVTEVENMLGSVCGILGRLTTHRIEQLYLIKSSPRYVDRLTETLKKTLGQADKMVALQRLMISKREELIEEQATTEPKLDLIISKTKQLKKQIEGDVSKKYKNRPVNLMGEINTI
ncbi:unnamed protein product [Owenia fusiformis]|uniref:CDK5 regulatory subunit-associated protein 3 n=1 Tax=Owenia fusiformis TaxID=6347 RepID=A0A8S4N293_OWEFU|nr:unnamed protein product [Owenia fusiformis]